MGIELAEQYLITDLNKIPTKWRFDTTDGVIDFIDADIPQTVPYRSSGKFCVVGTQNYTSLPSPDSTSAIFYLTTVPSTSNPPFIVDSAGRISFADKQTSPEIAVKFLFKVANLELVNILISAGSLSLGYVYLGGNNWGVAVRYGGVSLFTLSGASGYPPSPTGNISTSNWYELEAYLNYQGNDGTADIFLYRVVLLEITLNPDRTINTITTKADTTGNFSTSNANSYTGNIWVFCANNSKIDFIRVFQGSGVSKL